MVNNAFDRRHVSGTLWNLYHNRPNQRRSHKASGLWHPEAEHDLFHAVVVLNLGGKWQKMQQMYPSLQTNLKKEVIETCHLREKWDIMRRWLEINPETSALLRKFVVDFDLHPIKLSTYKAPKPLRNLSESQEMRYDVDTIHPERKRREQ